MRDRLQNDAITHAGERHVSVALGADIDSVERAPIQGQRCWIPVPQ